MWIAVAVMKETIKILVIDDEESFSFFIKLNLEREILYNFNVTTACNGEEGLKLAKTIRPNLILLDFVMQDMGGTEVFEALHFDNRTRAIPVIFLTGLISNDELMKENGCVGGWEFMAKPVGREELLSRIISTLNLR